MQLVDLGERRLISEVLRRRYAPTTWRFGDDAAVVLPLSQVRGDGVVVATTDPAPEPVAWRFGQNDFYYYGWLTAALNLSDLAAAGATPAAVITSFVLPQDMSLRSFERLLDGVDECCASVGTRVAGGNLKEGSLHCEATAIGFVEGGNPLSRRGSQPGDSIYAIGDTGFFWAAMLVFENNLSVDADDRARLHNALLKPQPRVAAGTMLREKGLVTACTDNSDGLYGALWCLAEANGLGAVLEADQLHLDPLVADVAGQVNIDPLRLALGFGDLQLVCTVPKRNTADFLLVAESQGWNVCRIGAVIAKKGILLSRNGRTGEMTNLDNERFTVTSQFTGGIDAYRKRILQGDLWT